MMKAWYNTKINQQNLHTWGYFFKALIPYKGEWCLRLRFLLVSISVRWRVNNKK